MDLGLLFGFGSSSVIKNNIRWGVMFWEKKNQKSLSVASASGLGFHWLTILRLVQGVKITIGKIRPKEEKTAMSNHWYPFYPGDYLRDTAGLTLEQHGAYRLLLDYYYSTGGPLPCLEHCLRIARAMLEHEKESIRYVVKTFFYEDETGAFRNKRADAEISKQTVKSAKAKEKASAAAQKRWGKEDASSIPTGNQQAMLEQCQPQPQPQPEPELNTLDAEPPRVVKKKVEPNPLNQETWKQYSNAYRIKLGVEPVRNAKQNALIKQFVERVGKDAPNIIAFYLRSRMALYVRAGYPLSLAVRDAEKLATEWATGSQMTEGTARDQDRTGGNMALVEKIMRERGEM